MKLIPHPNDEQLSAWLGEASNGHLLWSHLHIDNVLSHGHKYWPSTWPDLSTAALREDRDYWAKAKEIAKEVQQWPDWMRTQGGDLYLSYKPRQQRRMRKGG